MAETVEQYQGIERDASFVRKFDDRLWAYCALRFKQRWPKRAIPAGYRLEGEEGWFFPKIWTRDFIDKHGADLRSPRPVSRPFDHDERAAAVERVLARHAHRVDRQTWLQELQSWGLPPGTQFLADASVIYPGGTTETFTEIRMRKGRWSPGAGRRSDEQQNLEDMLRIARRRDDEIVGGSPQLAAHPLAQAEWRP